MATEASLTLTNGERLTVRGFFNEGYQPLLFSGESPGVEGRSLSFHCPSADVPNVAHGNLLLVEERSFAVRAVEPCAPDSVWTLLILEELSNAD